MRLPRGLFFEGALSGRRADVVIGLAPRHLLDRLTDMCRARHDLLKIMESPARFGCLYWAVRTDDEAKWQSLHILCAALRR